MKKLDDKKFQNLLTSHPVYRPIKYEGTFEKGKIQQRIHGLPEEVILFEDINDGNNKIEEAERNLLTHIFRFFTQSDIEVSEAYVDLYLRIFKPTEVRIILLSFANVETIHIHAYAYLLDSLSIPQTEYKAFFEYSEILNKYNYFQIQKNQPGTKKDLSQFVLEDKEDMAIGIAIFSAFVEGIQLFGSFVILLNFSRFNKIKGIGQIIAGSMRDETLHTNSIIQLYHEFLKENPEIKKEKIEEKIHQVCKELIVFEEKFIDLAFELGPVVGLTKENVKDYLKYLADFRLKQLNLTPIYNISENPLPGINEFINVEQTNFFENRVTEYSKGIEGSDNKIFDDDDINLKK